MNASHQLNTRPPWVAIVGVDGSGKSAVIQQILRHHQSELAAEIIVLERARKAAPTGQPIQNYAQPPHAPLVSIAKLCWVALRWQLQYRRNYHPLRRRPALLLSDHDCFNGVVIDPLRYRYGGPPGLAAWVSRHVPRPHAFIFLDAPFEVIYARKQEASPQETRALIERYRQWAARTPNTFTIDASQPLEQVSAQAARKIALILQSPGADLTR
ncbi:MAG: hypothetical protein GYA48_09960 [Chloroflexi bacterium]|nr:hypothetical protein [Chloroflexota bacterium]